MALNRQNLEAFFKQRRELHRRKLQEEAEEGEEETLLYDQEAPLPTIPSHMLGDDKDQHSFSYKDTAPPLPSQPYIGTSTGASTSQEQPSTPFQRRMRRAGGSVSSWFGSVREIGGRLKNFRLDSDTSRAGSVQPLGYRPLHKEIAESLPVYDRPPTPPSVHSLHPEEEVEEQQQEVEQEVAVPEPHWSEKYRDFESVGNEFELGWGHRSIANHYRDIIRSHGYQFDYNRPIFKGDDNAFDHSIWYTTRKERKTNVVSVLKRIDDRIVRVNQRKEDDEDVEYAIKVVSLAYYKWKYRDYNVAVTAVRKEANILRRLEHPHIIKIEDYIPLADRQSGFPYTYIALVLEYMNGDLLHIITARKNRYPCMDPEECYPWFKQIALALGYLHYDIRGPNIQSIVVTHMALHPKNILYKVVDWSTGELCFKLTDFEECCIFDRSNIPLRLQDLFDTFTVQSFATKPYRHYMSAPELNKPDWQRQRARPTDVYSLAMCLCYCLVANMSESEQMVGEIRDNLDRKEGWQQLIGHMTNPDPDKRYSIYQVLEHPWIVETEFDRTTYKFLDHSQRNEPEVTHL